MSDQTGQKQFARIPKEVLIDTSLSPEARCVYAFLAMHLREASSCTIGHRRIAQMLGLNKDTVSKCILQLKTANHIVVAGEKKQRRRYLLTSAVFGRKQGKKDVVVSSPSGGRRFASLDYEREGFKTA